MVRSELSKIDRPDEILSPEHDWAALFGVGYRFGKWLPMVTYAKYHGNYTDPAVADERTDDLAFSLRYDLTSSSALKLQYDIFRDHSDAGITSYNGSGRYGNSSLITIAFDKAF